MPAAFAADVSCFRFRLRRQRYFAFAISRQRRYAIRYYVTSHCRYDCRQFAAMLLFYAVFFDAFAFAAALMMLSLFSAATLF